MSAAVPGLEGRIAGIAHNLGQLIAELPSSQAEAVEFDDGFRRPGAFGSEYVHYYSNYKIALSPDDVNDIASKLECVRAENCFDDYESAFEYLITMLESRVRHLAAGSHFSLISLGEDCLSRSIPTKWGLKPPRLLGEATMPFDLSVHPPEAVAEILESDFADYLRSERLSFDTDRNFSVDVRRGILWNHEVGSEWAENGFERLRSHYLRRIANFRTALNDGRSTLLLLYVSEALNDYIVRVAYRIARALNRLGTNRIAVACLVSSDACSLGVPKGRPARVEWAGRTPIMFFEIRRPYSWYTWWFHKHFTLPEGLCFEKSVIDCVIYAARSLA
jgi:hypothetical protein